MRAKQIKMEVGYQIFDITLDFILYKKIGWYLYTMTRSLEPTLNDSRIVGPPQFYHYSPHKRPTCKFLANGTHSCTFGSRL